MHVTGVQTCALPICDNGHLEVARYLHSCDASLLHVYNNNNVSPLYIACQEGHLEVARYLHSCDASLLNVNRNDNESPLYIACHQGHLEVAQYLVSLDVTKEQRTEGLQVAREEGHADIVAFLEGIAET